MENSIYKQKYLKYKEKYLKLKGGLINQIPVEKLIEIKDKDSIPEELVYYVDLMTIPNTEKIRVGSSINRIQPYFSDVDVMNIVNNQVSSENFIKFFISELKKIVINLQNHPKVFFSDFKAGGLHWKVEDIINEYHPEGIKLDYALKIKDVVKIDMIAPYNNRYLEMSTFFILKSSEGYINVTDNYFDSLTTTLLKDINEYKVSKPFKAVKRVWSLSRIIKDFNTLNQLAELIRSNVALLAQINADIETIILLLEHNNRFDLQFVLTQLEGFKERLSHILDIDIDTLTINSLIDNIKFLFEENKVTIKSKLIDKLTKLHDYILIFINKETNEYLRNKNFIFPTQIPKNITLNEGLGIISE